MAIYTLVIILALLLIIQSQRSFGEEIDYQDADKQVNRTDDLLLYRDKDSGIQLGYPSNWTWFILGQGITPAEKIILFYPVNESSTEHVGITITIERMLSSVNIEEYSIIKSNDLEQLFSNIDYNIGYFNRTTISKQPAWELAYSITDHYSKESRIGIINWVMRGNNIYEISFMADKDKFSIHFPTALQIVDSFKFIG